MSSHLSKTIQDLDQQILSNSGVDSYEEIIKLLFLKLFDEIEQGNIFFNSPDFKNANAILKKADKKWPGIIKEAKFTIPQNILADCLEKIKDTSLFQEEISAFDTAIENLLPHTHRGSRGQFLTPRHVIKEIVEMVSPKSNEKLLDPACGSGGFLEYSILFQPPSKRKKYTEKNVFGADYDDRMTRIARLVCLKTAKVEANITTSNSLTQDIFKKKFDIIITNPPYGGLISDTSVLKKYNIAKNKKGVFQKTHRHILFIEKCIQLTKPTGRIALILPQGVLNNSGMKKVHDFIYKNCRVVGVISLPQNTFMPHTNVKTSILILEKWKDTKSEDYEIFMSISEKSGKDKKGNIVLHNNKIDHDLKKIRLQFEKFKKSKKFKW